MALYAVSTNNHSKAVTINKVLQAEKIDILRYVSHCVKEILKNLSSIYTFHSLQHTIEVIARGFLTERRYQDQEIMKISGCIKATQLPQNPQKLESLKAL